MKRIQINFVKNIITGFCLILLIFGLSYGQIRSGIGYLKIVPDARGVGMAGSTTSVLDYSYSYFSNPAATGLSREWFWSSSYSTWVSDIYHTTFLFGRRLRNPISQQTRMILGVNYLGIPTFNSARETTAGVGGHHLVATMSIGQPLSKLTPNLLWGFNVKYFNSQLADFNASAVIFDTGILFRSPRINFESASFNAFEYAIFTAGIGINNLGDEIHYNNQGTPLPETFRMGTALHLGSHRGVQLSTGIDYRQVKDEEGFLSLGTELSWRNFIAIQMGFSLEDNLLGNLTVGGSLQLNDQVFQNLFPGRNNALRVDLALNQENSFFDAPYHGTMTHQPLLPERFRMESPEMGAQIDEDAVHFRWEASRDPDLYDNLNYWLLASKDSVKLADVIKKSQEDPVSLIYELPKMNFHINERLLQTEFLSTRLNSGKYYWLVFAYDRDQHIRFANRGRYKIANFTLTAPDPEILAFVFEPDSWITEDDYQGKLKIVIKNLGEKVAKNFQLQLFDNFPAQVNPEKPVNSDSIHSVRPAMVKKDIPELKSGDSTAFVIGWHTLTPGLHAISAKIVKLEDSLTTKLHTQRTEKFFTIPKGRFFTSDTLLAAKVYTKIFELPYIGKIFFGQNSAVIKNQFGKISSVLPPLTNFARRLNEQRDLKVRLQGTADPNADEINVNLANTRALAVRDSLIKLGVRSEQIMIMPGELLAKRTLPKNQNDARHILEERRFVTISIEESIEKVLFYPVQSVNKRKEFYPVQFNGEISSVVALESSFMALELNETSDLISILSKFAKNRLFRPFDWQISESRLKEQINGEIQNLGYSLTLTDSLGRKFRTRPKNAVLNTEKMNIERSYYLIAKFAEAKPYYNFYWSNLEDMIPHLLQSPDKRIKFVGHGCAVGPEGVNKILSIRRARIFHERFVKDLKTRHPDIFNKIRHRIDAPEGHGESEPLEFLSPTDEKILLGDNETALGRLLNRRVMVTIYTEQK
ncbi:PorV/PorQ family protein [candidate division KSB1 bacterium]|nr:PorV/PorQ family protein [candidate division KSB1 bacterium]